MAGLEAIIDKLANVGNAAETAYAVLREAIVTNTLKPGTRLRADDLAGQLGVSKTPVREALRKLQAESLVTMQPGNVLTVKSIGEQELLEIYYTREALEGMAARLAAQNATEEDLAALRHAYARHVLAAQEKDGGPVWRSTDEDFHLIIGRASKNPTLIQLLCEDFYQLVRFYRTQLVHIRGRGERTVAEHRRILEAIEDRDGDLAELQMRRHIAAARSQLTAALEQQHRSSP
jgi:DNA-binding GntR family transcriptional regulator